MLAGPAHPTTPNSFGTSRLREFDLGSDHLLHGDKISRTTESPDALGHRCANASRVGSPWAVWTPAIVRLAMTRSMPHGAESLSDLSSGGVVIALALVGAIYGFGWRIARGGSGEVESEGL